MSRGNPLLLAMPIVEGRAKENGLPFLRQQDRINGMLHRTIGFPGSGGFGQDESCPYCGAIDSYGQSAVQGFPARRLLHYLGNLRWFSVLPG